MASGRDGFGSGWSAIQASRGPSKAGGARRLMAVLFTTGLPRPRFLLVPAIDDMI